MKICPITMEVIQAGEGKYSRLGLKMLSKNLKHLEDFPYSRAEQIEEARARADKFSVQGVQTKLSARLSVAKQNFELVDKRGLFILKPQSELYDQLPENEALTMQLARVSHFDVPLSGLIYAKDGAMTYFIKRFDWKGTRKLPQEDFAQLSDKTRRTKYNSSMEEVASIVEKFSTFPAIEKLKLFRLVLFNFLVGNEDAHLKNFSLVTRDDVIKCSPVYDLLNSTIALKRPREELALPLKGKKTKITQNDLLKYYAGERLGLSPAQISTMINELKVHLPSWRILIERSFLQPENKKKYFEILEERAATLGLL